MTHDDPARIIADTAPALLGYFVRRTEEAEDAADLLGDTMASAWKSVRRMPSEDEAARMWVFGIARNVLAHHRRGSRRRDALVERVAAAITVARMPDDAAILDVRAAVDSLPTELAELVRLVHWDGFTVEEAAAHLGVPASTARSRHARAKQLLRQTLHLLEAAGP